MSTQYPGRWCGLTVGHAAGPVVEVPGLGVPLVGGLGDGVGVELHEQQQVHQQPPHQRLVSRHLSCYLLLHTPEVAGNLKITMILIIYLNAKIFHTKYLKHCPPAARARGRLR